MSLKELSACDCGTTPTTPFSVYANRSSGYKGLEFQITKEKVATAKDRWASREMDQKKLIKKEKS